MADGISDVSCFDFSKDFPRRNPTTPAVDKSPVGKTDDLKVLRLLKNITAIKNLARVSFKSITLLRQQLIRLDGTVKVLK